MAIGTSSVRRGFGSRGVRSGTPQPKQQPRALTYAALSVPGPDEAPPPSEQFSIWKEIELFWIRMKWQLVLGCIIVGLYTVVRVFFWGVEVTVKEAAKELGRELGDEMRSLAVSCNDPAARKQAEKAGWTVQVDPDGGCRIQRPLK